MIKQDENLDEQIIRRLRICGHFLHFQTGGKAGQRRILSILLDYERISQRELQEILDVRSASVSEILNKMETEELIRREKDERDKRQVTLCLTESGRKRAVMLKEAYLKLVEKMFEGMEAEEKTQLFQSLDRLVGSWEAVSRDANYEAILEQLKQS